MAKNIDKIDPDNGEWKTVIDFIEIDAKRRQRVTRTIDKILSLQWKYLDIRKLKGYDNAYRVCKDDIRIIFIDKDNDIEVLSIGYRDDDTYKDL
jgi:mRNA-degrading endonuclease RelE of RelBE toxin-antitoxin system